MAVPVPPSNATVDVFAALEAPRYSRCVRVAAAVTAKGWQRMVRLVGCQPFHQGRCQSAVAFPCWLCKWRLVTLISFPKKKVVSFKYVFFQIGNGKSPFIANDLFRVYVCVFRCEYLDSSRIPGRKKCETWNSHRIRTKPALIDPADPPKIPIFWPKLKTLGEVPDFYMEGMSHDSTPCTDCRSFRSSICSSPPVIPGIETFFPASNHRSSTEIRSSTPPQRQVYYLYASPLDQPPIDVRSEVETIHEAFVEAWN